MDGVSPSLIFKRIMTATAPSVPEKRRAEMLPKHILSLTGIRFFAAAWVVVFHYRDEFTALVPGFGMIANFVGQGFQAVPLFFILSGFILSHTYFATYSFRDHPHFVFLRFARLWPVHLATIAILLCYVALLTLRKGHFVSDNFSFAALPTELAMIRCWFSKNLIWNYPAWSIQSEWFAYLFIFPLAAVCVRKANKPILLGAAAVGLLALQSFLPIDKFPGKCADIAFLFFVGSCLYRLRVLLGEQSLHWAAMLGGFFLLAGLETSLIFSNFLINCGFALIVFGLSYGRGTLSWILSRRWIVYGGTISYSLYMTHAVVGKFYGLFSRKLILSSQPVRLVVFFCLLAALLGAAMALYHTVEFPCNKALRALRSGRKKLSKDLPSLALGSASASLFKSAE
jgi:peptidoglycan/LPS O-acetylase OafA/YrhL